MAPQLAGDRYVSFLEQQAQLRSASHGSSSPAKRADRTSPDLKDPAPTAAAGPEAQNSLAQALKGRYVLVVPPFGKPYAFPACHGSGWRTLGRCMHRAVMAGVPGERNVDVRILGEDHTARTVAIKALAASLGRDCPRVGEGVAFISDVRRLLAKESQSSTVLSVDDLGLVSGVAFSLALQELCEPSTFAWEEFYDLGEQDWIRAGGLRDECRTLLAALERAWRRAFYVVWLGAMTAELGRVVDFIQRASVGSGREPVGTIALRDGSTDRAAHHGYVLLLCEPGQKLDFCEPFVTASQWVALQDALRGLPEASALEDIKAPEPLGRSESGVGGKEGEGGKGAAEEGGDTAAVLKAAEGDAAGLSSGSTWSGAVMAVALAAVVVAGASLKATK